MLPSPPQPHQATFDGNHDDCFRCGIRLNRKSAKLYSAFYKSDIVLASPLGLRVALGEGDKKRDVDWLSSIEIAVLGYADLLMMQACFSSAMYLPPSFLASPFFSPSALPSSLCLASPLA